MGRTLAQLKQQGDIDLTSQTLSQEEKKNLAANHIPWQMMQVSETTGGQFGSKWKITIMLDGQERFLTLGKNDTRDAHMEQFKEILIDGPIDGCALIKIGDAPLGEIYAIDAA